MSAVNTLDVAKTLDEALPDEQVIQDLLHILWEEAGAEGADIELDGSPLHIPSRIDVAIVTKAFFKEYYDIPFGTGYKAQVALGGVAHQEFGVLQAKYCFATLYYDDRQRLLTVDFHRQVR